MTDRDLLWVTDQHLQITMLSARLRSLCNLTTDRAALHVSELWQREDPYGIAIVAHQWALEGERVSFETPYDGRHYRLTLDPLFTPDGSVGGVVGHAADTRGEESARTWQLETFAEVERLCGFGSWRTDLRTGKTTHSPGLNRIFGLAPEARIDDLRRFDHADDAAGVAEMVRESAATAHGYRGDHRIVRSDGVVRHVHEQAHVLRDGEGQPHAIVGSIIDITERKIAEARLAQLAHYDPVSNLPNRALLNQRLGASVARAERNGSVCAVLFLDIDNFKRVNDTYGHPAGDELLAAVGTRLIRHVRVSDTVARMSGDEFVIVLDDLRDHACAIDAARKILQSFEAPFALSETEYRVSASIGVSSFPENARSAAELIEVADREMYVVKRNGGRGIKAAPARKETGAAADEKAAWRTSSEDAIRLRTAASG